MKHSFLNMNIQYKAPIDNIFTSLIDRVNNERSGVRRMSDAKTTSRSGSLVDVDLKIKVVCTKSSHYYIVE